MRILVVKHGALGDIVLTFPAFAGIRANHPAAEISLLTTAPYAGLLAASPWFDRILADAKPGAWQLAGLWRLRRQLRGYDLVYDLQTSSRSSRYFMLAGRPRWSGVAPGCALPHANPARNAMHSRERLAEQLASAGLAALPVPDLSWLRADIARLALPPAYAVLVPGAAPHRPEKRWPARDFGALASRLALPAVVVGAAGETSLAAAIRQAAANAIDLTGATTLAELASVIANAAFAIGNDTGPMHLAAALGVPSTVLFGPASNPERIAPRYPDGGWPVILRAAHLPDLPVAQVLGSLP